MVGWRLRELRSNKMSFSKTGKSSVISVSESEKEVKVQASSDTEDKNKEDKKENNSK